MNSLKTLVAITAASIMFSGLAPAQAQEVETQPIEAKNLTKGKQALSADKAYIYISAPNRTNGVFIKTPDADEIAEYEADWQKQFEKEVKRYPRKLARWKSDQALPATSKRRKANKPIEPKLENFAIDDIERRLTVSFGPQFVYDKDTDGPGEKTFSYLIEVEPGTFTYYGPMFIAPNGQAAGTCYCMGSVKFDAPAGQVTSLGDFLGFQWVTAETARMSSVDVDPEFSPPGRPVDYSVPASLEDFGAAPADLRAAGKMNNYFGLMIGRLPPVEGVLAYERDTPIDLKGLAEQQVEAELAVETERVVKVKAAEAEVDPAQEIAVGAPVDVVAE